MNNKNFLYCIGVFLFLQLFTYHIIAFPNLSNQISSEAWQKKYVNNDVTGSHVIALWSFDNKKNPDHDDSGNNFNAVKGGFTVSKSGKFGSSIIVTTSDNNSSSVAKNSKSLSPTCEFSLEMWINPISQESIKNEIILIGDLDRVLNSGYNLSLMLDANNKYQMSVDLGFGVKTINLKSNSFLIENNTWQHIAFTYSGSGIGKFYLNGHKIGEYFESGVSQIQPSNNDLIIGKRVVSNTTNNLVLKIDEVRITNKALEYSPFNLEIQSDRQSFVRMEKDAHMKIRIKNISNTSASNVTFKIGWGWNGLGSKFKYTRNFKNIPIEYLDKGATYDIEIPIDTKLRPDEYLLTVDYSVEGNSEKYLLDYYHITIVDRKLPDEYPVVMWGPSWGGFGILDKLKSIGFTHSFGVDNIDYGKIWKAEKATAPGTEEFVHQTRRYLDKALASGITIIPSLRPTMYLDTILKYKRIDQNGQIIPKAHLTPHYPEIKAFTYNVGESLAKAFGDLPAFGGALLQSETRDASVPSFHKIEKELFKKYSGMDIPQGIRGKRADHYTKIPNFPKDRVISDNDSLYTYFKWYWKEGDGWNNANNEYDRGLKTTARATSDFWTFQDPAVRTGSVYGSGGNADVISHWTYTYPDPLKIGFVTDQLLCMADGAKRHQEAMSMTQIIWYRDQVAPRLQDNRKFDPDTIALWEKALPETGTQYMTVSPAHLSEAFWTKIARPIKGIMYHGWQSLVPDQYHSSYLFSNDATVLKLKELIKNVIEPLGPTLKSVPAVKNDVAFYESFASQVYAGRGTMGWGGTWLGDSYLALNYAGLQPDVVYDETITRDGLKDYKILFMMDCDVITESIRTIIIDFQKKGGIVVGDKAITPAITPDIILERNVRSGHSFEDKNQLVSIAAGLTQSLEKFGYKFYLSSSDSNLITYLRRYKDTDYVFLINDNREYGNYLGQHGLVMENGKPVQSKLIIKRNNGFAYDLVNHKLLENFTTDKFGIVGNISLGSAEGSLIMITDKKIHDIKLNGPERLSKGETVTYKISVCDENGKDIEAIIPIEIEVKDSEGRVLEKSGYWKASGGKLEITLDIAENDVLGIWQISAKELASGKSVYLYPRMGDEVKIKTFEDKDKTDSFQING